jgi:plastocyanin
MILKIGHSLSKTSSLKWFIAMAIVFLFTLSLLALSPTNRALSLGEEVNETNKQSSGTRQPIQIISDIRILLNQTLDEYKKQNYTGAQDLATKAYLDNFEFIEVPLLRLDKTLKQNTELMLREQIRQFIKDKVPFEDVQKLVNNINSNLDQAEKILSESNNITLSNNTVMLSNNSQSDTNNRDGMKIYSVNSTDIVKTTSTGNNTNDTKGIATPKSITTSKNKQVLIDDEESDKPFNPSPINISVGDTVKWINTDVEIHTVTSGSSNGNTGIGRQFDSGNLNPKQTFEHTFNKAGTYHYFCIIHPSMTGVVDVK